MLSLATLAVFLRCLAVFFAATHRFGFDDLFAVITLVSSSETSCVHGLFFVCASIMLLCLQLYLR